MALCIRTISNKCPLSVGTRKPVGQLHRQLQKPTIMPTFLDEFINSPSVSVNMTLKYYALNAYKPSSTVTYSHVYLDHRLSMLKMQSLKNARAVQKCKTNLVYITSNKSNYKGSHHQRIEIKTLNRNNVLMNNCLFSQIKVATKENPQIQLDENGTMMVDELEKTKSLKEGDDSREGRPSLEQLEKIKEHLSYNLPRIFIQMMDYSIYDKEIVFINNIRGIETKGFFSYYLQMSMLKIHGHVKYAYVKFHILKITVNPEDDSVKVRWRISGLGGLKVVMKFWKFRIWNTQENIKSEQETWYDGFSTYYVNSSGNVSKHVIDKMMPDQIELKHGKPEIPVKLAICLGICNMDFILINIIDKF